MIDQNVMIDNVDPSRDTTSNITKHVNHITGGEGHVPKWKYQTVCGRPKWKEYRALCEPKEYDLVRFAIIN